MRHRTSGHLEAAGLMALLVAQGCGASWQRTALTHPDPVPERQQVRVFAGGHTYQWHGLVATADSLSGIPYFQSLQCESCRQAVPLAAVDSVQRGNPVDGFWNSVALVVVLTLVAAYVGCAFAYGCTFGD